MRKPPYRIALTGTESTGKTTLAQQLAAHFQADYVPEYARQYIAELERPYHLEDIEQIAKMQCHIEDECAKKSRHELLFCDTELIVTKIWAENAFQRIPKWISDALRNRPQHDLYLLMDIDLPWQPDPQREHPHLRQYFFEWYQKELNAYGVNWVLISGVGAARRQQAIEAVEHLLAQKQLK